MPRCVVLVSNSACLLSCFPCVSPCILFQRRGLHNRPATRLYSTVGEHTLHASTHTVLCKGVQRRYHRTSMVSKASVSTERANVVSSMYNHATCICMSTRYSTTWRHVWTVLLLFKSTHHCVVTTVHQTLYKLCTNYLLPCKHLSFAAAPFITDNSPVAL